MGLANIKSQIKRNLQNEKRRVRNRVFRGRARTLIQKARLDIQQASLSNEAVDKSAPEKTVRAAISALDKAAQKGVLHKNNAARRKSRLMKQLAALK